MIKFETIFHRARKHYLKGHKIRTKIYRIIIKIVYQCDILPSTDISDSTYFCHNAVGVVINPSAIIRGNNSAQRYYRRT